jgi:signal transduction histidine kinase
MKKPSRIALAWNRLAGSDAAAGSHEFVASFASRALSILDPEERRAFMEAEIRRALDLHRVEIMVRPEGAERFTSESTRIRGTIGRVLGILDGSGESFLNETVAQRLGVSAILRAMQATCAFPIRQRGMALGLLLIDSSPRDSLAPGLEGVLAALCDQTALVLENSNLLKSRLELQHTIAAQAHMVQLGEMTARIAHEIKNPLSSIKTIVQVMQEDPELKLKYAQDLGLICSEVDRLASTVSQLLSFARPTEVQQESVRLFEVARSVLDFLQHDIQSSGVTTENEIPVELPSVPGATATFREIFLNLLLNAMQAADERTTLIRLTAWEGILEDGSEGFVLLVVEDDGPGVPEQIRERVFTPFFTTRQRGTGLGLSIVKRNVEHLGGRVTLESPVRDGRGTRFLMHLPLVRI